MGVSTCDNEEFLIYKHKWSGIVREIQLPEDINTGMGQSILSRLDEVYAYLRVDLGEIEAAHSRAESIIRQHERSKAIGKNEDDRKKNATEYLENFPTGEGEETVNMYEWFRLLNSRYIVIKSLVDVISNKQQRLITMSGFMKVDSTLGNKY